MPSPGGAPATPRANRRRARTRATILTAAETLFSRHGYNGTRIEEVAEAADVSVGTIYTHFGGKQDLHLHLVDRSLELFSAYMSRAQDESLSPLQRVLAGGDAYLRFHLDHPGAFDFLALRGANPQSDSAVDKRVCDRIDEMLRSFAGQIDEAVEAGEARPVDSMRLTRYLWGAWNGVIALRHQPAGLCIGDEEIAETLELARWLLCEGLAHPTLRDASGEVGSRIPLPHIALRDDRQE